MQGTKWAILNYWDYGHVISYGGTSLLINMACMGIVMSVRLYGEEVEEDLPLLGHHVFKA